MGTMRVTTSRAWQARNKVYPSVAAFRAVGQAPSVSFTNPLTVAPAVGTLRTVGRTPTVQSGGAEPLVYISFDDAPSSESDGGVYTGSVGTATLDITAPSGTPFEHLPTAGWGGGGAAKFYATSSGGGTYRGLTVDYAGSPAQLNVRYLAKWNTAYCSQFGNQKGDFFANGGTNFWSQQNAPAAAFGTKQLQLTYDSTQYIIHGNGQSCEDITDGGYEGALCNGANTGLGSQAAAGPFEYADWIDEWVCLEFQIASGEFRIYVTTVDRTYDGLYMWSEQNPAGSPSIVGIGGMYYIEPSLPAGAFILMDELVVSDTYIGPPGGF